MKIIKKDGSHKLFEPKKLCDSIKNSGADESLAIQTCAIVKDRLKSGMSTEDIFELTRKNLAATDPSIAAIYALDKGLSSLGPSGFIFEQYVSALFFELGYKVKTNFYAQGEAVEHEIDVVAEKGNTVFIIEAKYRNDHKSKIHINQIMYGDARLQDIKRKAKSVGDKREYYFWVVTNTQFTHNAINYVNKRDLQLMGWNFPLYINIKKIAYEKKLYPITVLPSLTKSFLQHCAQKNIILVKDLSLKTLEDLETEFKLTSRMALRIKHDIQQLIF